MGAVAGCGDDGGVSKVGQSLISATPERVAFAAIDLGAQDDTVVRIRNEGTGPLIISKHQLTYADPDGPREFELQGFKDATLAPGEDMAFAVIYRPLDPAPDSATLTVTSNAANAPELEIPITSTGQQSRLFIEAEGIGTLLGDELLIRSNTVGEPLEVPLRIYNVGGRPFDISSIEHIAGSEFELSGYPSPPETRVGMVIDEAASIEPFSVTASETLGLTLRYIPSDGGSDESTILFSCDATNCEGGRYELRIRAEAQTPAIVLSPEQLGFGAVAQGDSADGLVTVSNVGTALLRLSAIRLAPDFADTNGEITIETVGGAAWDPAASYTVEPGTTLDVGVRYSQADDSNDTAQLVVESNDPFIPAAISFLRGTAKLPRLEVVPPSLTFPLTALGLSTSATFTIHNGGSADLEINLPSLRDAAGVFELTNLADLPPVLAADERFDVQVRFTPTEPLPAGPDPTFNGVVLVTSPNSAAGTNEVQVVLTGPTAPEPQCLLTPIPQQLNWGVAARGQRTTLPGRLVNRGSGPCRVTGIRAQTGFGLSTYFSVGRISRALPVDLGPGEELSVDIVYFPLAAGLFDGLPDNGSVEVVVTDPYAPGTAVTCGLVVPPGGLAPARSCGFGLVGRSAVADVTVLPASVDAGAVTVGCNSQTEEVRVYNSGRTDLSITAIRLEDCGSEWALAGVPALPVTVRSGVFETFDVRYRPTAPGVDNCRVVVETSVGSRVVPLRGEGVVSSRQVDTFEQVSGRDVDVLFVIDNSGSMSEEQANLANNFGNFINAARTWAAEFQIGIVTTEVGADQVQVPSIGNFAPGELVGDLDPRILTPAVSGYESLFRRWVRVGTGDGLNSDSEMGLEAAFRALSDPLVTDLGLTCDASCVAPYGCYAGSTYTPGSLCGGRNRTFIRENASLELVFLSDEDDVSERAASFYTDFFRSIKGFRNTSLFHANAIVGGRGGCSSSSGDAVEGSKYLDLADETGGVVASICDSNFASALSTIGNRAFGLRVEFFLTRPADPSTITVRVEGTPVASGWTYDATSNSILWSNEATAPQPGQEFEVEYDAQCF
jgi:hypothetical protein